MSEKKMTKQETINALDKLIKLFGYVGRTFDNLYLKEETKKK